MGEKLSKNKLKTPIVFTNYINGYGKICRPICRPEHYDVIELVSKGYGDNLDIMFAYNKEDNRSEGVLYLGQFNDGVV